MLSHRRRRHQHSAFTLIELLLVLVILAVLAGIVVVNFSGVFKTSKDSKAKADIHELETALEMYRTNCGDYPATLDALVNNPGSSGWQGPYIKRGIPNDPWNNSYVYSCPGQHNPNSFDLSTNGDGKTPVPELNNWTVAGTTH